MPALLMQRSGAAFMSDVSRRSCRPPTISGSASIASRITVNPGATALRGSLAGERAGVGEHRVGAGDLAQREGIGLDPAAVDGGHELLRGRPERPGDRRPVRDLRRMRRLPVVGGVPALQLREHERHRVLARAHVADRAGLLAVARESGRGERVERHALGAAGEELLADARAPEDPLERADVQVLARVRAREDRDLGRLEVEGGDAAGLDQRERAERLDRGAEGDDPVGIAEDPDELAAGVGFDDVAAVDALLDAVAELADEDGRHGAAAGRRADRGSTRTMRRGCGHDSDDLRGWSGTQDREDTAAAGRARRYDAS